MDIAVHKRARSPSPNVEPAITSQSESYSPTRSAASAGQAVKHRRTDGSAPDPAASVEASAATGPAAPFITYEQFVRLSARRSQLIPHSKCGYFGTVARGRIVRIRVQPAYPPSLRCIMDVVWKDQGQEPKLVLSDPVTNELTKQVTPSQLSDEPATNEDYQTFIRTSAQKTLSAAYACVSKHLPNVDVLLARQEEGRACAVLQPSPRASHSNLPQSLPAAHQPSSSQSWRLWGLPPLPKSGQQPHEVALILRSWLAQDLPASLSGTAVSTSEPNAVAAQAAASLISDAAPAEAVTPSCSAEINAPQLTTTAASSASASTGAAASLAMPATFAPCLAGMEARPTASAGTGDGLAGGSAPAPATVAFSGRGIDDKGLGLGPGRQLERTVGTFRYCMYRAAQPSSADVTGFFPLELLRGKASWTKDEYLSDLTACRLLREQLSDESITPTTFAAAILQQIDASNAGAENVGQPTPPFTPAGLRTRPLASGLQLFVIDGDSLARQAPLAHAGSLPAALLSSSGQPVANATELSWLSKLGAGRSAVWLSEEELVHYVSAAPSADPTAQLLRPLMGAPPPTPPSPPTESDATAACERLCAHYGLSPLPATAAEGKVTDTDAEAAARPHSAGLHPVPWPVLSQWTLPMSIPLAGDTGGTPPSKMENGDAWWSPFVFPRRRNRWIVTLYHGTSVDMARRIQSEGFRRPICRRIKGKCDGSGPLLCECQMEGFGVYLADRHKASEFATRRGAAAPSSAPSTDGKAHTRVLKGALVAVEVDLGHLIPAPRLQCPCNLCKRQRDKLYVDHWGTWYSRHGGDTLYLRPGSWPASSTAEWAVADPLRCTVVGVEEVERKLD